MDKSMTVECLGGALEIGGSSILLELHNKKILLDAGSRQGASKDPIPNFRAIQDYGGIDCIIISHAHLDHIGSLPIISKEYPNARIYMNNMTKDLVRVLLYDSLKIMNNREAEIPLYAEEDVEQCLDRIVAINFEVERRIFEDVTVTFYNAGHIAGASCVYLKSIEGAVFYSGDFSAFSQRTVEGCRIPKLNPDVAIIESTYGDKLHSNREIEEDKLIECVKNCISEKGKMIIPAFALGRAQEVLLILKKAMNTGRLPKVEVFVDGMVRNVNAVYKRNPLYLKNSLGKKVLRGIEPFYDEYIKPITKKNEREEIINKNEPVIIVASSGMLVGGPSAYYTEKIASMENGYVVITGYQDEESPGRKVLDLINDDGKERRIELNGISIPVCCKIFKIGLSAHGDKSEIKGLVQRIMPKHVFFVHGNKEVIEVLAKETVLEYSGKIYAPKCGERIEVFIGEPKKQLKKHMCYTLGKNEQINEDNIGELWEFVKDNYGEKLFTVEELFYIWYKTNCSDDQEILRFQQLVLHSAYFENDSRRLFLFKTRKEMDIQELLRPKELKENELLDIAKSKFKSYPYKKISLKMDEKKVVLNFDFPHALNHEIYDIMQNFTKETTWYIEINDKMNNNAADVLVRNLLEGIFIKKISYYTEQHVVEVDALVEHNVSEIEDEFRLKTGWTLRFQGESGKSSVAKKNIMVYEMDIEPKMDQNKAFNLIDMAFQNAKHKPYKKSIKMEGDKKYIEISFLSPQLALQYEEKIGHIVVETGWNIFIADKVNQNEIINIANMICSREDIVLKKNPSFDPMTKSVSMSIVQGKEKFQYILKEFKEQTGLELVLK